MRSNALRLYLGILHALPPFCQPKQTAGSMKHMESSVKTCRQVVNKLSSLSQPTSIETFALLENREWKSHHMFYSTVICNNIIIILILYYIFSTKLKEMKDFIFTLYYYIFLLIFKNMLTFKICSTFFQQELFVKFPV